MSKRKPKQIEVVTDDDVLADVMNDSTGELATDPVLPSLVVPDDYLVVMGKKLRPVTMATLCFLTRARSELMTGKPANEIGDFMMEVVIFFLVQQGTLADGMAMATKLQFMDTEERMLYIYEIAESIPSEEGTKLVGTVTRLLQNAFSTQVAPVAEKGGKSASSPGK